MGGGEEWPLRKKIKMKITDEKNGEGKREKMNFKCEGGMIDMHNVYPC